MKKCYFCGRLSKSLEHAPPQHMFRGFDCDCITVPSCNFHNSEKSGKDQAIIHGFFKSLSYCQNTLNGDVLRAFNLAKQSFHYTKRTAVKSKMFKNPTKEYSELPSLAYLTPGVKMLDWIRQLTAAIFYSGIQSYVPTIEWTKIKVESPEWLPAASQESVEVEEAHIHFKKMEEKKNYLSKLPWNNGWSAYPRPYPSSIYKFRLPFFEDEIIMNHIFYTQYTWYAWIPGAKQLISKLEDKILEYSVP